MTNGETHAIVIANKYTGDATISQKLKKLGEEVIEFTEAILVKDEEEILDEEFKKGDFVWLDKGKEHERLGRISKIKKEKAFDLAIIDHVIIGTETGNQWCLLRATKATDYEVLTALLDQGSKLLKVGCERMSDYTKNQNLLNNDYLDLDSPKNFCHNWTVNDYLEAFRVKGKFNEEPSLTVRDDEKLMSDWYYEMFKVKSDDYQETTIVQNKGGESIITVPKGVRFKFKTLD